MAEERRGQDERGIASNEALAGILALLVDERESRLKAPDQPLKTEVLLANAGVSVSGIVRVTGKKADAVRKAIERARKA